MSRDGTRLTYAGVEYRSHDGRWIDADGCVASLGTSRVLDGATQNKMQNVNDAIVDYKHSQKPMRSMLRDAEPDINIGLVDFLSRRARMSILEMRKMAAMLNMAADLKERADDRITLPPKD